MKRVDRLFVHYAVGGRRYAVYGHDWAAEPTAAWPLAMATAS